MTETIATTVERDQFTTMSKGALREWLDDFGLQVEDRATVDQLRWKCRTTIANARLSVYQDQMGYALAVLRGESVAISHAEAIKTVERVFHDARLMAVALGDLRRKGGGQA